MLKTILAVVVVAQGFALADEKPIHFPKTLDIQGFQAAAFDVGAAYVTGQPSQDALRKLSQEGFTMVVSVRTQAEMDDRQQVPFDEPALCKELGLDYVHIPFDELGPGLVERFSKSMRDAKGKVLLHCTVAWRATYMWMAYLVMDRKQTVDDAWKAGMSMSVTVDRSALMLGEDVSYTAIPKVEGARKPKQGVLSKPGSKLTITSPKAVYPPTSDFRAFVMWDMGDLLNTGQPDEKRFRELAAHGVRTVVNLRSPAEMASLKQEGFDEEAVAKELGLQYVSVPLSGYKSFTPEALAKVADAFDKSTGKVLFHCAVASRTTQVIVPYLVKYQGMDLDEATKVGESMRWTSMLQELLGMDFMYKLKPAKA